jgi:hypothetical protein
MTNNDDDDDKDSNSSSNVNNSTAPLKQQQENEQPNCGVVTYWLEMITRTGPASLLYQPIFPVHNPHQVVAWTGTTIHWEEVLTNIVPNFVNGLQCVIKAENTEDGGSYT